VLTLAILSWRGRHPTGISVLPSRLGLVLAAAGFVIFAAAPQWWFPDGGNRELRWAVWEQLIGSSYVIYAVIVLSASAANLAGIADLFTGGIAGGAEVRGVRPKVVQRPPEPVRLKADRIDLCPVAGALGVREHPEVAFGRHRQVNPARRYMTARSCPGSAVTRWSPSAQPNRSTLLTGTETAPAPARGVLAIRVPAATRTEMIGVYF
jgi:hypothetical protein